MMIVHRDRSSLARQPQRNRATYAPGGSGNQRGSAFQIHNDMVSGPGKALASLSRLFIKQGLSREQFRPPKRLIVIMGAKRRFLIQYRTAWEEFVCRTNALQGCLAASEPDRARVAVALLEAEKARLAYNAARDLLVAQMAGLQPAPEPTDQALPQDGKVRAIARILWELTGKPDGTAVADWLQAERLVQSASAAVAR